MAIKSQFIFSAILLGCWAATATPLKEPKRMVQGSTANLTPLFRWWSDHDGPRPLTAWVHVTGSIVGTNSFGWIVEGEAEKTRGSEKEEREGKQASVHKFVLKSPPLADRSEFETLLMQAAALNKQKAALLGEQMQAKSREDSLSKQRGVNRRNRFTETRVLRQTQNDAKAGVKGLDPQIEEIKKKLSNYPNAEHYTLDAFALQTGQKFGGLPVYDHGSSVP